MRAWGGVALLHTCWNKICICLKLSLPRWFLADACYEAEHPGERRQWRTWLQSSTHINMKHPEAVDSSSLQKAGFHQAWHLLCSLKHVTALHINKTQLKAFVEETSLSHHLSCQRFRLRSSNVSHDGVMNTLGQTLTTTWHFMICNISCDINAIRHKWLCYNYIK